MDKSAGTRFRVLLAEDDPVSRAFLGDAIRTCGGEPETCADGVSALERARAESWDLLILDHRLPGLNGDEILAALRAAPHSGDTSVPALATTADPEGVRASLMRAGFAEVLPKPLALDALRAALGRHGCPMNALDDDAALRACGTASAVEHLRRLFAEQELPRIQEELDRHRDHQSLCRTLHRLRASCGFCGTVGLARASETLHAALAAGTDPERIDGALDAFAHALAETRAALHASLNHGD